MKKSIMLLIVMLFVAVSSIITSTPATASPGEPPGKYVMLQSHPVQLAMATPDYEVSKTSGEATAFDYTSLKTATPVTTAIGDERSWFNELALPERDPNGIFGLGWPFLWACIVGAVSLFYYIYPTAEKWKWLTWILEVLAFVGPPNLRKQGGAHHKNLWLGLYQAFKR